MSILSNPTKCYGSKKTIRLCSVLGVVVLAVFLFLPTNVVRGEGTTATFTGAANAETTIGSLTSSEADAARAALDFEDFKGSNTDANGITENLALPDTGEYETAITWASSNTGVIGIDGTVIRPSQAAGDQTVALTATIAKGSGSATKTFTLTVKAAMSDNAGLSALTIDGCTLLPQFDADRVRYMVYVDLPVKSVTLFAEAAEGDASVAVTVNGLPAGTSSTANLNVGVNTLAVEVTAPDGSTKKEYTITVVRAGRRLSSGGFHSLALDINGNVVGWGVQGSVDVNKGQTTPPDGLAGVTSVAAAYLHSLALKSDGTVVAWGDSRSKETTPPAGLSGVVAVDGGRGWSLALKSDGTLAGWGHSDYPGRNIPDGLRDVVAIDAGEYHALALKSDGTVVGWSPSNRFGEATPPEGLSEVVAISAGSARSMALKADGTVVTWGRNDEGEITVPEGLDGVVAISAGNNSSFSGELTVHLLALKSDGTVVGWGKDEYGQISGAAGFSDLVAISAGLHFSTGLRRDGTVVAWGDNLRNQLAVPEGLNLLTPPELSDSQAVAADKAALDFDDFRGTNTEQNAVTSNLALPGSGSNGTMVVWTSSDDAYVSNAGAVTRPSLAAGDQTVTLTATISKGDASDTKVFTLVVKAQMTDGEAVPAAAAALTFDKIRGTNTSPDAITGNLVLSSAGEHGTTITWNSSDPGTISNTGVVTRPAAGQPDASVTLAATIRKGTESTTIHDRFALTVKAHIVITPPPPEPVEEKPFNFVINELDIRHTLGELCRRQVPDFQAGSGIIISNRALMGLKKQAKSIEIATSQVSLVVTPELAGSLLGNESAGSMVFVVTSASDGLEGPPYTSQVGAAVNIGIYARSRDDSFYAFGQDAEPFRDGVSLRFPYDPDTVTNPLRLGVYVSDGGTWQYAGGKVDADSNTITVRLRPDVQGAAGQGHAGPGIYSVFEFTRTFQDLSVHWSRDDVDVLASRYIVSGMPGGTYEPERNLKRGELAELLAKIAVFGDMKAEPDALDCTFTDVSPEDWHAGSMVLAGRLKLISGYPDGTYRPEGLLTREEIGAIVTRLLDALGIGAEEDPVEPGEGSSDLLDNFTDGKDVSGWARDYMRRAVQQGILKGLPGEELRPQSPVTRSQAAAIIRRILEKAGRL